MENIYKKLTILILTLFLLSISFKTVNATIYEFLDCRDGNCTGNLTCTGTNYVEWDETNEFMKVHIGDSNDGCYWNFNNTEGNSVYIVMNESVFIPVGQEALPHAFCDDSITFPNYCGGGGGQNGVTIGYNTEASAPDNGNYYSYSDVLGSNQWGTSFQNARTNYVESWNNWSLYVDTTGNTIETIINSTFQFNTSRLGTINNLSFMGWADVSSAAGSIFYVSVVCISDVKGECDVLITEGENITVDSTPPIIITNLTNNSIYDTSIDFYVNINENGNCNINNSNWTKTGINNTYWIFQDNDISDGNYNIEISCNDTSLNNDISFYNFTKATPYILITEPLNDTDNNETEINITFLFNNFNANSCYLYSDYNLSYFNFDFIDNITIGEINITIEENITVLREEAKGFWSFEENSGSTVYDNSTFSNDGTNIGLASYISSKGTNNTGSYALDFDGVNDYIRISDSDSLTIQNGTGFTIGAWIYMNDASAFRIAGKRESADSTEFFFTVDGSDYPRVQIYDCDGDFIGRTSPIVTSDENTWIHLVFTYSGSGLSNGIKIYRNGVSVDNLNTESGVFDYVCDYVDVDFEIGSLNNGTSLADGYIDEVFFVMEELTQENITSIMNEGIDFFKNITTISNTTTINQTLNKTTNYTLSLTGLSILEDVELNFYVNCSDNSNYYLSDILHVYHHHTHIPTIEVVFPNKTYNDTYNFNMWLNITVDENVTCVSNNTAFTPLVFNETDINFFENTLNNSFYTVNISCTDYFGNKNYTIVHFTKDKQFPIIDFLNPNNENTTIITAQSFYLVINMSDNNDLALFNVNITQINEIPFLPDEEEVLFSDNVNLSGEGQEYIYSQLINISSWDNGLKYAKGEVCDSHTGFAMKDLKTKIKKNEVTFIKNNPIIIKALNLNVKKTKINKKKDRYSITFEYENFTPIKEYEIIGENAIYLGYSKYKGHIIFLKDKLWLDFENEGKVSVRKENGNYIVSVVNNDNNITFNSIGSLNCFSRSVIFNTDITIILPSDELTSRQLTNTLILFTIIVFIQLFFISLAMKHDKKGLLLASTLMGILIAISFIRFIPMNSPLKNAMLIYLFINVIVLLGLKKF